MAYYTAVYKKDDFYKNCKLEWESKNFKSYSWGSRLFLYTKDDYRIGELIDGYDGLEKYHKGSFEVWLENIRKKDLKKLEALNQYQSDLKNDIEVIETIWKKSTGLLT